MEFQVTAFPAAALPSKGGQGFDLPFTAWVYRDARSDEGLVPKKLLQRLINKHVSWTEEQTALFEARSALFLRVGLGKVPISLKVAGVELWSGHTSADGFIQGTAYLSSKIAQELSGVVDNPRLHAYCAGGELSIELQVSFPKSSPFVVVSDIDDTLKFSSVWNTREMLARTFANQYEPIPEVAESFQRWEAEGAEFHYVSTSPWQLFEPLKGFLLEHGFPPGLLHLRRLNWRRPNPFVRRSRSKVHALMTLLGAYPSRRFILVGDDVERDPELYSKVAREFPGQVDKVFIRNVRDERGGIRDFHRARSSEVVGTWRSFSKGSELNELLE